eukprot:g79821.t1
MSGFSFGGAAASSDGKDPKPEDYENQYGEFDDDVVGSDDEASGSDDGLSGLQARDSGDTSGLFGNQFGQTAAKEDQPFLTFDFRRGANKWPEGVTLVSPKLAEELLKQAKEAAQETVSKKDETEGATGPEGAEGMGGAAGMSRYTGFGSDGAGGVYVSIAVESITWLYSVVFFTFPAGLE